jgi:hypothetical protein
VSIDNYEQAIALKHKLEAALPFRIKPTKQLLKVIKEQEGGVPDLNWFDVDSVMYSGDAGGILLNLRPGGDSAKAVYSTSLTHVVFDPDHELASEVHAYQQARTRKLMLQERGGFAAELLAQRPGQKRQKKRKGFGG